MQIILGSGSPRRKEILSAYGIEFKVITSDCDENISETVPEEIVKQLSNRKATAVFQYVNTLADNEKKLLLDSEDDYIVIGADTIVAYGNEVLGKPKNRDDAKRMIRMLQGKSHQVYTGVTLIKKEEIITFAEKTEVYVKPMSEEEIENYVATGEGDDKAGSYAIQGIFKAYIDRFEGDYNNVVGLPADSVLENLWKLGYHLPKSHVKMVVSDIDGTLVKDSSPEIYPEMLDAIKKLRENGILFCIASGRQYASIRNMFMEVADDIIFLCENGAHLVYQGKNLHIKEMKDNLKRELIKELRTYGDERSYVISTPEGSYLENPAESFEILIRDSYHNKYEVVDDFLALQKPSIKIAIYRKGSIRELGESILIPKWKPYLKTCMAGEEWVDFMDPEVDKGNALEFLQDYFGVTAEETMVFGDNANDLGMLEKAQESYVVSNARPEIKERANTICPAYWNKGVMKIIRDRLL